MNTLFETNFGRCVASLSVFILWFLAVELIIFVGVPFSTDLDFFIDLTQGLSVIIFFTAGLYLAMRLVIGGDFLSYRYNLGWRSLSMALFLVSAMNMIGLGQLMGEATEIGTALENEILGVSLIVMFALALVFLRLVVANQPRSGHDR